MARSTLIFFAWLLAALSFGCAEAPILVAESPLFVFNTYPSSGTTIALEDLWEVSVTFSADLGDDELARDQAADLVELSDEVAKIDIARDDRTNISYDGDTFTLRILIDPDVRRNIRVGVHTLTVRQPVRDVEGRTLPTDFVARFQVAE